MARLVQAAVLGPLISATGSTTLGVMWWWKPFNQEDVQFLKELIDAGRLAPVNDRRYPLRAVPEALRYMKEGLSRGKIIITM